MAAKGSFEYVTTHYKVLGIPWNSLADAELSPQYLRAAYRRALFQHHPDKTGPYPDSRHEIEPGNKSNKKTKYTIDQITEAYTTLSVPKLRSEYDRGIKLRAGHSKGAEHGEDQMFRSGLEIVDLDDLTYDEIGEIWFRSCRCGEGQGFQIREADLEEASDEGELHVGCRGCSLWLKVLFGVVEDKDDGPIT